MSDDPYSPPAADPQVAAGPVDACPACRAALEPGSVTGTLRWLPERPTAMDRFVGGRKLLGPKSFSITLGETRTAARRCPACGLILLHPAG